MEEPIEIPIKLTLGDIKKQLREIKSDLAAATDPEEMARLSEKAGELKDNLIRVNEQSAVFASGSKFEQSANALGLMNSQIASLDFEGAAESALLLQDRINSITPEEVTKQMEGLTQVFSTMGKIGGQVITGMIKNVGAMAKAFLTFGVQLMSHPIFLIGAAIAAIVGIIVLLLSKLGLLKPILKAIGDFFKMIGDAIDWVVQKIKDFLDWIGLTDFAAEDSARKHAEASEKKADAYEKAGARITETLDHEIRMNQLNGKDTTRLEIQKQEVLRKTAKLRLDALKARYEENKLTGEMDAEELKAIREKLEAQRAIIRQSNNEIEYIREKDRVDEKKKREEAAKEASEQQTANAKQNAEKAKQWAADRLAAERQYRDAELQLMQEGKEKELAQERERFKRLLEDTKKNEKLTAEEKTKLKGIYLQQEKEALQKIEQTYTEKEAEEAKKKSLLLAEIAARQEPLNLQARLDFIEAQKLAELEAKDLTEEEKRLIELKYQEEAATAAEEYRDKTLQAELKKTEQLAELALLKNEDDLNARLTLLEAQKQIELSNKELTEEEKALIEERYRQAREDAEKQAADKRKKIEAEAMKATETGLGALMDLNELVFSIRSNKLKKGSEEEEKAARRNFEINKKLQIGQAVIQGVQATLAAYSSGLAIPVVGNIVAPIYAAAAAITALNNVNKIKSATYGGGSAGGDSGGAAASSGAGASAQTNAPQFNLYGQANQGNNTKEGETVQAINVNVKTEISEAEITGTQSKVNQYEKAATLNG